MFDFLNKPYPYYFSCKRNFMVALMVGIFVLFLVIFRFDALFVKDYITADKIESAFGFGLGSFFGIWLVFTVLSTIFFSKERKDNWKIKNEITVIIILHFVILIFDYLFLLYFAKDFNAVFSLSFILDLSIIIFGYGLIPSTFIVWIDYTVNLKLNLRQVKNNNKQLKEMLKDYSNPIEEDKELTSVKAIGNGQEFDINELLFMKSDGNYIEIYKREEGKVVKSLTRGSISNFEDNLNEFSFIIKTHRSYLVNIKNIKNTKGNARNYQLFFEGIDIVVPVSRTRFGPFNNAFKKFYEGSSNSI